MFTRFSKESLINRSLIIAIIASFIISGGLVSGVAKVLAADNIRTKALADGGSGLEELMSDPDINGRKYDGGNRKVIAVSDLRKVIREKNINSGFISLDWNIKKIKKAEDLERIVKSLDSIEYVFNELGTQYLFGVTHRMRPKAGVFKEEESLKELVDNARKLMAERKLENVLVELLPYDLDQAAQAIKDLKTKNPGKKILFIVENIRFYGEEKSKDAGVRKVFEQKLIDLTNRNAEQLFYINEAFDKSHRGKEASMEMVKLIPDENRAAGIALEKDLSAVLDFQTKLTGKLVLFVGGAKFDKLENIAAIAEAKGKNLVIVLGGAQANVWRSLVEKKSVGKSLMPSGEDLDAAKEALGKIAKSGAAVIAPVDFTVTSTLAGLSPDGVIRDVQDINDDEMQVDVGKRSLQQLKDLVSSLNSGDGFIMNGGAGKFDDKNPVMSEGTLALIDIALEAQQKGVAILGAGGDMFEALKKYQEVKSVDVLKKVGYTTGGGVVWALIGQGPENLPAIAAVTKAESASSVSKDGGMAVTNRILVLDNHIGLFEGADTGTSNAMHARAQGADGVILNHSEDRETLELLFKAKANEILKLYESAFETNQGLEKVQSDIRKDFINYLKREAGIIAPDEKDMNKKKPFVDAGITISYEELNKKVDEWLSGLYKVTPETQQEVVEVFYRSVVNKIMNIKLKQQIFHSSVYNKPEVILCSGETEAQYLAKRTRDVLKLDHEQMLEGISPADIARINFIRAYEPRWAIGTGKTPTNQEITDTHVFIIDLDNTLINDEAPVLYGGSMNEKNEESILGLPGVSGGLIGGKALAPADIGLMVDIAVKVGQKMNKMFYMGMNWKAAEAKPAGTFVKMFKDKDLSKIRISIGTPTVKLVKDQIQKPMDSWRQKLILVAARLKLGLDSLSGFVAADAERNNLKGGKALSDMTSELLKPKLRAELEGVKDSRGKQTIRAVIETGLGITGIGEAPAGKSTGDAEAKTVDDFARIENEIIPYIAKKLADGNYDFTDYDDVVRAHEMLIREAGPDYSILGGNVTTAVSWAIYDLHAKLKNLNLDKAIAQAEPEAVGTGSVNYIANVLNGGLHSIIEALGEKIGVDRMSIQEMMFVPLTRKFAKRLEMLDQADGRLGKRLVAAYGKENISRGDEAGYKIKFTGKADDKEALDHVIAQAVESGLKPGKDFLVSLDVAASEFYNEATRRYTFLGKEMTSQDMIKFYADLVDEYKAKFGVNVFYSIEDGLGQNDWDGWVALTKEMTSRGVLTVGDDLFCTNIERLRKGIEMGAASAILIKVNQNGTVWGTLQVIKLARQYGIKIFISHRSGETLYAGIAALANGVKADALKTGAPQPENAYPDKSTWVRRAKYLLMNMFEKGEVLNKKGKAFIVSADYIVKAGISAVSELDKLADARLIIYGKGARKAAELLGLQGINVKGIMTAKDQHNAISIARTEVGFKLENIVLVRTSAEPEAREGMAEVRQVLKQVAADGLCPALELGKAIKMLYKDSKSSREVNIALEKVISSVDEKVVRKMSEDQKVALIESNSGTFDFTSSFTAIGLTEEVAKAAKEVGIQFDSVMSQI